MEIYSFDNERLLSNYYKLLHLYQNASTDKEKVKIYNEIIALSIFIDKNKRFIIKPPSFYKKTILEEKIKRINFFKEIESQTRILAEYWKQGIESITTFHDFNNLNKTKHTKGSFKLSLIDFFTEIFPEDLSIVNSSFEEKRIRVKKNQIFSHSASITYLESIGEYYIALSYNHNLTDRFVGYLVHEYGHASCYIKSGKWQSYDYLLEETVAFLYEMLYIDYKDQNKSLEIKLSNMKNYFKSIGIYHLFNYFETVKEGNNLYLEYINIIISFYASIVSLTLYSQRNDNNFKDKIDYIKQNFSTMPAFVLLENIDIKEKDLIDTAKNMKQKILSRD